MSDFQSFTMFYMMRCLASRDSGSFRFYAC